jgi:hypothetical protein
METRLLRVAVTEKEQRAMNALAAAAGEHKAEFLARALRRSPVTRQAFKTKETK